MAVREIQTAIRFNAPIAASAVMYAGMVVAPDTNGNAVLATRAWGAQIVAFTSGGALTLTDATALGTIYACTSGGVTKHYKRGQVIGVLAEDKCRTGATMIQVDPVGASVVSADGTIFTAYNNGLFVAAKRALGDFVDETITNVSDLSSPGSTAYAPAKRGVSVYSQSGTQLVIDTKGYCMFATADTSATSFCDVAYTPFVPGDLLTTGIGANAGKFVKLDSPAATNFFLCDAIARVDKYDSVAALLYITLL